MSFFSPEIQVLAAKVIGSACLFSEKDIPFLYCMSIMFQFFEVFRSVSDRYNNL